MGIYGYVVRRMIHRSARALRNGDIDPMLATFGHTTDYRYPGDHAFAGHFRTRDEVAEWLRKVVAVRLQFHPTDIVVKGPPWRTTVVMRYEDHILDEGGAIVYENRGVHFGQMRWGKVLFDEVYSDTQKAAALDAYLRSTGDEPDDTKIPSLTPREAG